MMDSNGLSLGDAMALTGERGSGGFGDGSGAWVLILLFAMIFGWGGNGFGGNRTAGEPVTEAGLCNAMNFNGLENSVGRGFDSLETRFTVTQSGLANLGYAQLEGVNSINTNVMQTGFGIQSAIAQSAADAAQCCCATQRAIDGVNYNAAMNTAAVTQAVDAGTQKILDAISGNRMADMQNQINQLQLQNAVAGVVRYPTTFSYNAGPSPFCGGCGCGNI